MRVLLIGATGATAKYALPMLLEAKHQVTVFVRNPDALPVKDQNIVIKRGDVRDAAALDDAVKGQEAVLALFGPRSIAKDDLQETFMRHLVAAMEHHGVKRLVNLAAWGSAGTRSHILRFFWLFRMTILRNVFNDKDRGEKLLFASKLEYVNVSPGRLTEGAQTGRIKVSEDGKGVPNSISRADLAAWMIEQLNSPTWVRKSPIIGAR